MYITVQDTSPVKKFQILLSTGLYFVFACNTLRQVLVYILFCSCHICPLCSMVPLLLGVFIDGLEKNQLKTGRSKSPAGTVHPSIVTVYLT
jgi:hypothetical protein